MASNSCGLVSITPVEVALIMAGIGEAIRQSRVKASEARARPVRNIDEINSYERDEGKIAAYRLVVVNQDTGFTEDQLARFKSLVGLLTDLTPDYEAARDALIAKIDRALLDERSQFHRMVRDSDKLVQTAADGRQRIIRFARDIRMRPIMTIEEVGPQGRVLDTQSIFFTEAEFTVFVGMASRA